MTFPITKGDEVLVIISSRCIDSWWQLGAVDAQGNAFPRPQLEYRMHDLSDGFIIPGPKSVPNVIPNISNNSVQIRTNISTTSNYAYIELKPSDYTVNVVTTGSVNITAPTTTITGNVHITGNVQVDQTLTATTDVVGGGKSLKSHTHGGVQTGSGTSRHKYV